LETMPKNLATMPGLIVGWSEQVPEKSML
jgi:hypothetical protein